LGRIPFSVVDALSQIKARDCAMQQIIELELSNCQLQDADMPLVQELVGHLPRCTCVDLRKNDVDGDAETSRNALLRMLNARVYGDIINNRMGTARRQDDLFVHLKVEEALYLIWIPEVWLEGEGWKTLLQSHLHALTEHAHEIHYRRH
jgi:hypothetical protein